MLHAAALPDLVEVGEVAEAADHGSGLVGDASEHEDRAGQLGVDVGERAKDLRRVGRGQDLDPPLGGEAREELDQQVNPGWMKAVFDLFDEDE